MDEPRESESHRLIGGELCLDFANTVNEHMRPSPHEYLFDYRDMLLWGRHAGVLSAEEFGELLGKAARHPGQAQAVFRQALDLRETIFRIFTALGAGSRVDENDLERLGAIWQVGQARLRLFHSVDGFSLGWDDEPSLERLARRVAASAIHLLTSPQMHQVRICRGEHCDWLFIDTSRNHLRRWCSMDECGNRAKMQRRSIKQKLTATAG